MDEFNKNKSYEWEKLQSTRHHFISVMAQNMGLYGISETNGRLYGTVLFSDAPMTLDSMSKALEMSKTSMSTGVRALSDACMLSRVWEKGVRKDLYQTEDDWYKSFISVFVNRWREATDNNHDAALEAIHELKEINEQTDDVSLQEQIETDINKLQQAVKYYSWLDEVIALFENGDIFQIVEKK
ncbi:GbsR/MarR family transcriptional regulator [Alteribacillus bidgolensis]|uniref:HTH-type transcriptional regulator n=1 Tax=Alteribacillus bidgolensis TaxID=930129 RepID=A0A1G8HLZ5_9BACI|nr:GbsR/MarR family transcriptional regulator [Alteribacillus bidgolensis]SDI07706.1 DNA-binding transcriptional regulator GbsR, MarR family [Alteribacillus bidgolensis]